MTDFIIDGTIERIGEHTFDSCKALKAMLLPTTVNYIGSYAFYDCNSMTSINIPNGIEKIMSHTFYGCASLGNIEVPNSVIAIEDYAFYGCAVATNITLSNQCKTIGEAAFYNCKALTELTIPNSVTSIGAYAFRSCGGITELVFSDNVDEIGACAFYDCNGLVTVKLGKKIIELGDRLFYGCVNLESLYVYAPLSYIDTLAFYGADFVTVYCGRDDYMINFFDENGIMYEILDGLVYQYKITFVTDNGEIISSGIYDSGATITAPDNPTKAADATYTYVFAGWDQEVSVVGGNKTYTASFTPVYIEYIVVFTDYNGNTISSTTYHYGDTVTIPSNPTRAADNTYTYAFAGWDNEVVTCEGDTTYTATYTPTYIEYTVEFKDFGGEILSSRTYHYDDTIIVPANPTRAADLLGTYSFKGWDKEIVTCAGDATYTATYDITYIDYTVTFKNHDGSVISTNTYHYGDTVAEPSAPKKPSDGNYYYEFAGWDKSVTICSGDAVYTATFIPKDLPQVIINDSSARAGETVTVNILLSGAPNLESLAISNIIYDTTTFELINFEWKTDGAILSNWDATTGKGAVAYTSAVDLNGTIISLTFKISDTAADGNYGISCVVTSHECDFKNISGIITVYSVALGDVDGNEVIDKNDAIYLLMHSFFPEDYPINQEADYNGDGAVDKDDAIYLLMYTFFPDDYPLALAPASTTGITTTEERKKDDEE